MTEALVRGMSEAAALTPQHTSVLVNSLHKDARVHGNQLVGTVGYAAGYAMPVHKASGKLKGQPLRRLWGSVWGKDFQHLKNQKTLSKSIT
jgi:hypothetical protein